MKSLTSPFRLLAGLLLGLCALYSAKGLALHLTAQQAHIDVPLSNICVQAFRRGTYVGTRLFPTVPVQKQSDVYYTIDKATWMRLPSSALRAPKTRPRRIEFNVSTDRYFADNYALAGENPFEALRNADSPIKLRQRTGVKVVGDLAGVQEVRIANKVTSISNIGSGVLLTGTAKWSDYGNSDPISDITTGHAFIRNNTGVRANTLLLDYDTHETVRRHPVLLDMYKYTQGGFINDAEITECFKVENLIVADAIRNVAPEGAAASMVNIWGNNALLCYVDRSAPSLETATFGLGMEWNGDGEPGGMGMQARVYDDPDPGKKTEVVEVGHYMDEKVVARELGYLVGNTL
jgi:hypothetical protein